MGKVIKKELGDVTLYCGDMRDVLPFLNPVDCVVTDNPYKLTSGGKNTGQMKGIFDPAVYDNSGSLCRSDIDWDDWLPLCYKVLKNNSHAYFFANDKNLENLLNKPKKHGFKRHTLLPWIKGNKIPNRWYMLEDEFVALFRKGLARPINNCGDGQNLFVSNLRGKTHPNEKPVKLMQKLVLNSTQPGEVVLDPFIGLGTTAIACLETGRKCIGIEIEKDIFDKAVARVEEYQRKCC